MIVAGGLLPVLPGDSFQTTIRQLTHHLSRGELALNGYTRFSAWSMQFHPAIKALGIDAARGFVAREPAAFPPSFWGNPLRHG